MDYSITIPRKMSEGKLNAACEKICCEKIKNGEHKVSENSVPLKHKKQSVSLKAKKGIIVLQETTIN